MRTPALVALSLVFPLTVGAAAVPAVAGGMYVESCSLGCSSGAGGAQVQAQVVDVHQDLELGVVFSLAVDPASVSGASFRIVKVADGTTPAGSFSLDPFDARRVVFRPLLSFDQAGTPVHGMEADTAYSIFVPGTGQGDAGPFVRSAGGLDNQSRFQHTVVTSQGLLGPIRESCATSPNSVGSGAVLDLTGRTSLADGTIAASVQLAPPGVMGVFFAGSEPRRLPFGEGLRCAGGHLWRLAPAVTDAVGSAGRTLPLGGLGAGPGGLRFFQFWYRDTTASGVASSNLSGALEVRLYP